jgi:hypothetical protein
MSLHDRHRWPPRQHTTFTVEPCADGQTLVRIDSSFEASGLEGWLTQLVVPRMLRPLDDDELERLDRCARAMASASVA